jgi:hypothetical protein
LAVARYQMGFDALSGGGFMELQVWICGVRKNPEHTRMGALVQSARHVQNDGFCAIHPAATDDVQNLHVQQRPPALFD